MRRTIVEDVFHRNDFALHIESIETDDLEKVAQIDGRRRHIMSIAVCVLIAWLLITTLFLIPKTLTEREMVFLFFICTIFELSMFTVFHLNLHWIDVSKSVEKALADLVMRLICIPVVLVITSNALLHPSKFVRWGVAAAVVLAGIALQLTLKWLGILTTPKWNLGYTVILFSGYIAFARLMTWFITRFEKREVSAE